MNTNNTGLESLLMHFGLKDIIAWWGAVLSTILAYYTIRGKRVNVHFLYHEDWREHEVVKNTLEPYVDISIVNKSERPLVIHKILVERLVSQKETVFPLDSPVINQKLLQGELYNYNLSLLKEKATMSIHDYRDFNNESIPMDEKQFKTTYYFPEKVRLLVFDSNGNKHNSQWFTLTPNSECKQFKDFLS